MTSVTLDTNLVIVYLKNDEKAIVVARLLELGRTGQLNLAVTTRVHSDVPRPPLADRLNELPELGIKQIGSVFRLNHSLLDGEDRLGNTKVRNVTDRIREECRRRSIKPPDCRDWDHLHGHCLAERDVFLTSWWFITANDLPETSVMMFGVARPSRPPPT